MSASNFQTLPAAPENPALRFDAHSFDGRPAAPASQETALAFSDLFNMRVQTKHKPHGSRKLRAPVFAADNSTLAHVVTVYCERRAGLKHAGDETLLERVTVAQKKILAQHPNLKKRLDKLCGEFVGSSDADRRAVLQIEIENLDTRLRLENNLAPLVCAVAYSYWLLGWDSPQIGAEYRLKPTMIRQWIFRLSAVAKQLGYV